MSTKLELLFEQLYYKYITGEVDIPRIPSDSTITNTITADYTNDIDPIFDITKFNQLNYDKLKNSIQSIIDDIDILYQSVDMQSQKILDQLTYSLIEYRGIKFTLDKIYNDALDINSGKTDIDNIRYVYTENFASLNNINTDISTIDRNTKFPVIDLESKTMYIPNNTLNIIDMSHYYGKKLDFIPSKYAGTIVGKPRYIGSADIATILNISNLEDRLTYELKSSMQTPMQIAFSLQLRSDGNPESINAISLVIDSENTKGYFRLQYLTDAGWSDVDVQREINTDTTTSKYSSTNPVIKIDSDKLQIRFKTIETSNLKFIFIKEVPDNLEDNSYYISLYNLSIYSSTTHKISTLISKSTEIKPYGNEDPVIANISAEIKGYIPEDCFVDIYVAQDKLIPAYFIDKYGSYVSPQSLNIYELKTIDTTDNKNDLVNLSDIKGKTNISGVAQYNDIDFDWKLLKSFSSDNLKPEVIKLIDLNRKDPYENSICNIRYVLFGDSYYNITLSGTYPQSDYPTQLDPWFLNDCIDPSSPNWSGIYKPMIQNNLLISGFCWDPTQHGFPFNWYNNPKHRTLVFNERIEVVPGWYRPDSDIVTPEGIVNKNGDLDEHLIASITEPDPEFYINGIKFYKVYCFESNSEVVSSDINLYTYQTRPYNGTTISGVNEYYPHNMIWHYVDRYIPYTVTELIPNAGSGIISLPLYSGEYINDSMKNVFYYDENFYLDQTRHYDIVGPTESGLIVDMSPIGNDDIYKPDATVSFTYSYNTINNYMSYWDGYIIVNSDNSEILIKQQTYNESNIVERIKIINTASQEAITKSNNDDYIFIGDSRKTFTLNRGIYSLRIFVQTDVNGSYPANWWSPNSSEFIEVIGNARIVPDVNPMTTVALETLLYTTTYENDYRCSVITDTDGLRYIIVKEPSKNIIPGYYFDSTKSTYILNDSHRIKNIGHYKRTYIRPTGVFKEEYITGSKELNIMSGIYIDDTSYDIDYTWNDGKLYPQDFKNTEDKLYRQHSTYGSPLNIDNEEYNKGHIFYNTAENLPAFYTIEYGLVDRQDASINKFLYKINLKSEHETYTPILNSLKFTINTNIEEL